MAKWQTHHLEVVTPVRVWRFDSSPAHKYYNKVIRMNWFKKMPYWLRGGILGFVVYILRIAILLLLVVTNLIPINIFEPDLMDRVFIATLEPIQTVTGWDLVRHPSWWGPSITTEGMVVCIGIIVCLGTLLGYLYGLAKRRVSSLHA